MSARPETPMVNNGVLLLSGGLDSVAALFWAKARYVDLRAISFEYGQPNRDAELTVAQRTAREHGVPWESVHVGDCLRPMKPAGILGGVTDPDPAKFGGIDKAFVPGRNILFATVALAHAATWWPVGNIDLIIGACAEDQAGFPDCRPTVLAELAAALRRGLARQVTIRSPWADMTKSQILYALKPDAEAVGAVQRSFSCYRYKGPCGTCGACVKRAAAFEAQGLPDLAAWPKMGGGDPHREAR